MVTDHDVYPKGVTRGFNPFFQSLKSQARSTGGFDTYMFIMLLLESGQMVQGSHPLYFSVDSDSCYEICWVVR